MHQAISPIQALLESVLHQPPPPPPPPEEPVQLQQLQEQLAAVAASVGVVKEVVSAEVVAEELPVVRDLRARQQQAVLQLQELMDEKEMLHRVVKERDAELLHWKKQAVVFRHLWITQ